MVWVRGSGMPEPVPETVPLIVRDNDHSMSNILLTAALEKIGRPYELVVTASLMHAVTDATDAGMGLTAYAKRRIGATGLAICRDKSLPPLADLTCSLCVRESAESKMLDDLVGMIARIVSPEDSVVLAKKLQVARPPR
jgi:hypothetical protein